jgi:pilus biogenesis lipoprotein CpaD
MSRALHLLASMTVTAVAACGCTTATVVFPEPAIVVEPAEHELLLRSSREQHRLAAFLLRASEGRLDAIHVTVIAAHPGVRHAVVRTVRAVGVEPSKIRQVHAVAASRESFAARVVAVRFHAHPPPCPPLYVVGPSADANDFDPMLGCSDLANLALQVNDPRDLVGNPAVAATDGERAAVPVARSDRSAPAPRASPARPRGNAARSDGAAGHSIMPAAKNALAMRSK